MSLKNAERLVSYFKEKGMTKQLEDFKAKKAHKYPQLFEEKVEEKSSPKSSKKKGE
jgi:hypothetical protein